jgi:hypothetical protein
MPCRSYEDDFPSSQRSAADQEQIDRLARIACKAMQELERQGVEDFILLGDEEVRNWWKKHKEADAKAAAEAQARAERHAQREEAKRRKEELKARALSKLDPDEIKALGVKL